MKKIYTIGREEGCDIVIPDKSDVISRLHATIRIESENNIYITDQSRNGTYVNGIKISSNVEVPVSRKDVISFAHIVDFDWSVIPKQKSKRLKWAIIILSLILIGICVAIFIVTPNRTIDPQTPNIERQPVVSGDTILRDTIVRIDTLILKPQTPVKVHPTHTEKDKDTIKINETKEEEIYNPIY